MKTRNILQIKNMPRLTKISFLSRQYGMSRLSGISDIELDNITISVVENIVGDADFDVDLFR